MLIQHHWKVLIADDERIIREGIREAVDWTSLQLQIVAEAEDGEEALERSLKHKIDIILVDLNMPIMGGITLIKMLRQRLPECRVIIVTGHDEFAYAQEGIRLNVTDYIMKPVNPEQLTNVLNKVCKEIETEKSQKKHLDMASKQIRKNIPLLRERFCIDWIEGNMTEEEVLEQLQFLQLPMTRPHMLGVIRWPEMKTNQPLMRENDRQLILFGIENIMSEWLKDYEKVLFRDHLGLIIVVLWSEISPEVLSQIETSIRSYLGIMTKQHFEAISDDLMVIPDIYNYCKSKVYDKSQISQIVRRAQQYMYENFSHSNITLESVAQSLHVSSVYLSRIIKQDLGITFGHLLVQMRINKAIELLNATNLTINEISQRVGYDTQHYFSTSFKKVIGVSPNQYRKGAAFLNDVSDNNE